MARFGFPGGSYTLQSVNANCQKTQNWIPEADESGFGVSAMHLNPTPGLALFAALPHGMVRAIFEFKGVLYAVADSGFYVVTQDGTFTQAGVVADDGKPAQISANASQILIVSGGSAYYYQVSGKSVSGVAAGGFAQIDTTSGNAIQGPVVQCGGTDGYLIVLIANSQSIQISNLEDATTWALSGVPTVVTVNDFPDNVLAMLVDHRQVWLFGQKATLPYYDSGSANIFDPVPSGYVEQGIVAPFSPVKMNNSIFLLGGSDRGAGIAWNIQGYQPIRVSNYAVEQEWNTYPTIADAEGYAYEDGGHTFWMLRFPTANKTWCFDAATGLWHERSTWNPAQGAAGAHASRCHAYCYGKHLVGDPNSGNVYWMAAPQQSASGAWQFCTDNGAQIIRIRRAPHISTEKQWIFHQQLQVDLQAGVGPVPPLVDGNNAPRDPQLMLRWSDDGGHAWSQYLNCGFGQAGNYTARAIWRRLGKSRDRVYEVSCADPVGVWLIDAYLEANPGFGPQERMSAQLGKIA